MGSNGSSSLYLCYVIIVITGLISVANCAQYNHTYNSLQRDSRYGNQDDFLIPESHEQRSHRKSKLFPLFTIIRFTNEVCRTTNEEAGICYTRNQCSALGGLAQGNCASGLGVCCRFVATCGAIIYQNSTSFQNPNYPSKYTPTGGSDVCQGPAAVPAGTGATTMNNAGVCNVDSLAITSSGATVPSLCGIMNGHHVYVDFGSSDTVTLNLLLGGGSQRERTWNIEILTIPCNSVARAPTGCLQYHTGVSGQVESFNFQGGLHLSNLDYSVCVRMEDGMRFIDWTPCGTNTVRFGGGAVPPPTTAAANTACLAPDYFVIMQGISFPLATATTTPTSTTDRFCDTSFLAAGSYIRTSARPFILHIRTDSSEGAAMDLTSMGYCLRWQQNPQ